MGVIEDQVVKVKWNNSNSEHFKKLGYNFKIGEIFTIPYCHLTKGSQVRIKVKCDEEHCENINEIQYCNFYKKQDSKYSCKKHSQSYYIQVAKMKGFELLSAYEGSTKYVKVKCAYGHIQDKNWSQIMKGSSCLLCFREGMGYSKEYIEEKFNEKGFTLLENNYKNEKSVLKYICDKGHVGTIVWNYFQQGAGCQTCYNESRFREGNPRWNKDKSKEQRLYDRKFYEYAVWRKNVLMRDNYTCQKCNKHSHTYMFAHHIFNYLENLDIGLDVNNGITFCEHCHINFHKQYGHVNNNYMQLFDYIHRSSY